MAQRTSHKVALLAGAALGALGLTSNAAQAGGFFIHEQSTYFQGTSFAGVAAGGPAISAMFWNPATITQIGPGLAGETDATALFAKTNINPTVATGFTGASLLPFGPSGDIAKDAFIPASYYTYGFSNGVSIGLALNAPFGERTQPKPTWAGEFYSRNSDVKTLNINPTIAYQVTPWLSVGVGAQIEYFKFKLEQAFPGSGVLAPVPLPDNLHIDGTSWDFGWTAGLTLTPTAWTTIGIGYRSRIDHDVEGQIFRPAFIVPPPPVLIAFPSAAVAYTATVPLPDVGTVSIRQKVSETFTLLGTVEWTNWSRLGTIPVNVTFPPGGAAIPGIPAALPFEWRDGWLFSVGGEYAWSPSWLLRAGVAFERSPIDDRVRGTRLPDNDRVWLSAGATYNWSNRLALEIAYSHVFVKDSPINISAASGNPLFNPVLGTFIGDANSQADIISVGLRYKMGPAPAAAPLITKG
jgi:long-chain fatty acid transport protein